MIYFIQPVAGGFIKIGHAADIGQRLGMLSKEHSIELRVLGVMDGSRSEETELHNRFAKHWVAGEWFQPGEEILHFVTHYARSWDGVENESSRVVYIRKGLADLLQELADERLSSFPEEVANAIRNYLARHGKMKPDPPEV